MIMKKVFVAKNETDEVLTMYPSVHEKKPEVNSFDRLNMLWEKLKDPGKRIVPTIIK